MTNIFMLACTYIVVGASINGISLLIKSDFLCKFLDQNLILLLVAILAINTTTISVILSKMREIADKNPGVDFGRTIRAMKHSTLEHIYLVGGAVALQIIKGSDLVCKKLLYAEFIADSLLIAIFIFSIHIVYDTAKSVYVILDYGH